MSKKTKIGVDNYLASRDKISIPRDVITYH